MKRPIVFLNLILAASFAAGSFELRRRWLEARERESQLLALKPVSALAGDSIPVPPAGAPQKLQPLQYFEVAERFLFSRDRNPNVVIEKKPEPPPKVMPNFPSVFGVMDIGMGPTVFMAIGKNNQQGYKLGDQIGEFKLIAADPKDITFEWEGKSITKAIDDLRSKPQEPSQQASNERTNAIPDAAPTSPPPPKMPENVRPAPGSEIGGGRRGCLSGDTSPSGTVADGYKKVSTSYAFGPICYWEPVR